MPSEAGPPALQPYGGTGFLGPALDRLVLRGIYESTLPYPDTAKENRTEVLNIFSRCEASSLLSVSPMPDCPKSLCRVFGAVKTESADRMIGDRRGPNALEARVRGVSSELSFSVALGFCVGRASTDRSDYWCHQIWTKPQRTASKSFRANREGLLPAAQGLQHLFFACPLRP